MTRLCNSFSFLHFKLRVLLSTFCVGTTPELIHWSRYSFYPVNSKLKLFNQLKYHRNSAHSTTKTFSIHPYKDCRLRITYVSSVTFQIVWPCTELRKHSPDHTEYKYCVMSNRTSTSTPFLWLSRNFHYGFRVTFSLKMNLTSEYSFYFVVKSL